MTYPLPEPTFDAPVYAAAPAPTPPKRHRVRNTLTVIVAAFVALAVAGGVINATKKKETVVAAAPVLRSPATTAAAPAPVPTTAAYVPPVVVTVGYATSMLDQRVIDAVDPLMAVLDDISADADRYDADAMTRDCAIASGLAQDLLDMYSHIDEPSGRLMASAMRADIKGFDACVVGDYDSAITYMSLASDLIGEASDAL